MKKSHEIDMTVGRMMPKLIAFVLPLMLSSVLQLAFNAADLIVVGRFGRPTALAAVGSNGSLINLIVNVLMGFGIGGGVLSARFFGAHEGDKLDETIGTSLMLALFGGIVTAGLGISFAVPLLRLIGSPDDVAPLAAVYLRIYFAGVPVIALYNFASADLRALGNTREPLYYLAIAGVLNVIMNLFFVIVVGIDVAGVALATVLSQCVSCALTVRCLLRTRSLRIRELRFAPNRLKTIVQIGLPAGIQGSLFSISNFLIQSSVNLFGSAVIAGNAACVSLEGIANAGQDAAMQGAVTAVSQNVGAQNYKRSCTAVWQSFVIMTGLTVIIAGLIYLFRAPLVHLYTTDPASVEAAYIRLRVLMLAYVLNGTMAIVAGTNRGLGYSMMSAGITLVSVCVFRVIWIYSVFPAYMTLNSIYVCYPVTWTLATVGGLVGYFIMRKRPFRSLAKTN